MKKQMKVFKLFETPNHKYVYDRHSNSIICLSENDYFELRQVEQSKRAPQDCSFIQKMELEGGFLDNVVTKIEHPETDYLEHYVHNCMSQLILQVTQQCNLRCDYCIYSGKYSNRSHSNKKMDYTTAKKAIDFFAANIREQKDINISFYGGEPLLEFDLIKKCVDYANETIEGRNVRYSMTTNGTLITSDIVEFFMEHNFQTLISLDGAKEEHDINRKFVNGRGSFDTIMSNVRMIKEKYPEYIKSISFNTVINPKSNLSCVLEFFSTDQIMSDLTVMFSDVNPGPQVQKDEFNERFDLVRKFEYIKLLLSIVKKVDEECVSPLVKSGIKQIDDLYNNLYNHRPLAKINHHGGPCIPGVRRLFVSTVGNLFPCERINEASDFFMIGSLDNGLDLDKVQAILNIGKITEEECINCWNLSHCAMCASELKLVGNNYDQISRESKLKKCESSKARTLENFLELCALHEYGYRLPQEEVHAR